MWSQFTLGIETAVECQLDIWSTAKELNEAERIF
jgi:hypothetical protein